MASTLTFTSGSGPAVPDAPDPSNLNPGAPVTLSILVPSGNNYVVNPGDSVTVTLVNGWNHTFVSDLVIALTGPSGPAMNVLNQQGGSCNLNPASSYVFNNSNSTAFPSGSSQCPGGVIPAGNYIPSAAGFSSAWNGVNIDHSTWTLSAQDFFNGDTQSAGWTWSVTFSVSDAPTGVPEPSTIGCMLIGLGWIGARELRRRRR